MATTWSSFGRSSKAVCTTGTEAAPSSTGNPTEGASLTDGSAYTVTVEAATGQTLSGAGSLNAYLWDQAFDNGAGGWSRCPSLDIATTTASVRRLTGSPQTLTGKRGRVAYVPNGVTVSAGNITVYINQQE